MAISLAGKIVIVVVVLAVVAGMTTMIVFLVNEDGEETTTEEPTTPTTTTTAAPTPPPPDMPYDVGVGIADMTGPCAEITFMGYADFGQSGQGIHTRQFSRAFIFVKENTRIVLVTAEVQAVGIAVRREVVRNLQELYGDIYNLRNVIITGTHTHATPGGHLVDFLLDISIRGFSNETFNAYVDGITRSIVRAHENIVPARLIYGQSRLNNTQLNRSVYSYNQNVDVDRYNTTTDDQLLQVRIERADGSLHGVLSWFSVHTTSMNMTNHLISSDNLGYAALRMEKTLNPISPAGKPEVVAGFFTASLGDVSPNTRGARCEFSGNECDNQIHRCEAGERCYSLGPGEDMFESTRIIGTRVYEGAMEALNSPGEELLGELAIVHQFVEMPEQSVPRYDATSRTFNNDEMVHGCVAAMGYSFAAGTIDGANTLPFPQVRERPRPKEGFLIHIKRNFVVPLSVCQDPFSKELVEGVIEGINIIDYIMGIISPEEDYECHAPKPILLPTGRANWPIPWHPRTVSVTIIWLADFVVAGVPGEPTTMTGRRIKDVVGSVMEEHGFEPRVAVSGVTNDYIHYVATYEEYQVQRYEAASTIYGPHTLDILLNKFHEFTTAILNGSADEVDSGPEPADNRAGTVSLILPVLFDAAPLGSSFGAVLEPPPPSVRRGDTVSVTFVGANPRNDLKQESTFLAIERFELGQWRVVATDADWETRFHWERQSVLTGTSRVRIEWTVPEDALVLPHRVVYFGVRSRVVGSDSEFTGYSDSFNVVA